jgi:hypothetical protein
MVLAQLIILTTDAATPYVVTAVGDARANAPLHLAVRYALRYI